MSKRGRTRRWLTLCLAVAAASVVVHLTPRPAESTPPSVGATVEVVNTGGIGLRLRAAPRTDGQEIANLRDGTRMKVTGGPVQQGGYTWWQVSAPAGSGWVVGNWLNAVAATAPPPAPVPQPDSQLLAQIQQARSAVQQVMTQVSQHPALSSTDRASLGQELQRAVPMLDTAAAAAQRGDRAAASAQLSQAQQLLAGVSQRVTQIAQRPAPSPPAPATPPPAPVQQADPQLLGQIQQARSAVQQVMTQVSQHPMLSSTDRASLGQELQRAVPMLDTAAAAAQRGDRAAASAQLSQAQQLLAGVSQRVTQIAQRSQPGTPAPAPRPPSVPTVSGLAPNPAVGREGLQPFTVSGSGFVQGAQVVLRTEGEEQTIPMERTTYVSPNEIQFRANVASATGTWTAEVTNPDGRASNRAAFTVVAPPVVTPQPGGSAPRVSSPPVPPPSGGYTVTAPFDSRRPRFPVVLVHGICADASAWRDFSSEATQLGWRFGGTVRSSGDDLTAKAKADFYVVEFADKGIKVGLAKWAQELRGYLKRIADVRGLPRSKFIVVAHSAGGLAVRAYLQNSSIYQDDISQLITYGTPHQGAHIAEYRIAPCALGSQGMDEMRPGSAFLERLNTTPLPTGVIYSSLIGHASDCIFKVEGFQVRTTLIGPSIGDCVVEGSSQDLRKALRPPLVVPGPNVSYFPTGRCHHSKLCWSNNDETSDFAHIMLAMGISTSTIQAPSVPR